MSFFSITKVSSAGLRYGLTVAVILSGLSISAQQIFAGNTPVSPVPCDTLTHPGSIGGDQVIYPGNTPEMLFENTHPEGGAGAIKYLWMEYLELGSMPGQWYPILSATSASYQPGPLSSTRKFTRCATREGCNTWKQSNIITVTVKTAEF